MARNTPIPAPWIQCTLQQGPVHMTFQPRLSTAQLVAGWLGRRARQYPRRWDGVLGARAPGRTRQGRSPPLRNVWVGDDTSTALPPTRRRWWPLHRQVDGLDKTEVGDRLSHTGRSYYNPPHESTRCQFRCHAQPTIPRITALTRLSLFLARPATVLGTVCVRACSEQPPGLLHSLGDTPRPRLLKAHPSVLRRFGPRTPSEGSPSVPLHFPTLLTGSVLDY